MKKMNEKMFQKSFSEKPKKEEMKEKTDSWPGKVEYLEILETSGLEKTAEAFRKVLEICQTIEEKGGTALLVGGSVRDYYFGLSPKDYDLEVYGVEAEELEEMVVQFGRVSEVGKAFGILKIFLDNGLDIDVSLPRRDSKISPGHNGFRSKSDPEMSTEEAAKRRDFTINSLAVNPLTGELFDHFGGLRDIRERRLRITDEERFKDDPLRVLRGMQFVGRMGLKMDDQKTQKIMQECVSSLREISRERFFEEWAKLLLKSEKPSLGLQAGLNWGVIDEVYPELAKLPKTPQERKWHPEGDVWVHTLMAVDEMKKICQKIKINEERELVLLLASLCHDLGKPETTINSKGKIISHGHEEAGKIPSESFLKKIGVKKKIREKVVKLVINHLMPTNLFLQDQRSRGKRKGNVSDGAIRKLAERIFPATIEDLALVSMADHFGRGPFSRVRKEKGNVLKVDFFEPGFWLLKRANELDVASKKPKDMISGKDLIGLGFPLPTEHPAKGEPLFGEIIKLINRVRDLEDDLRKKLNQQEEPEKLSREEVFGILETFKGDLKTSIRELNDLIDVLKEEQE